MAWVFLSTHLVNLAVNHSRPHLKPLQLEKSPVKLQVSNWFWSQLVPFVDPRQFMASTLGPTSWVALASLHQVKHFCLAHGTYVCTINTKQDWTQPGSTFFFFLFKFQVFFNFELLKPKISKLCLGLKAVKQARVNWFFCASFSVFYFELSKLKVTLAVSSLV